MTADAHTESGDFYVLADATGITLSGDRLDRATRSTFRPGDRLTARTPRLNRRRKYVFVYPSLTAIADSARRSRNLVWPYTIYTVAGHSNWQTGAAVTALVRPQVIGTCLPSDLFGPNGIAVRSLLEQLDFAHQQDTAAARQYQRDRVRAQMVFGPGGAALLRSVEYRDAVRYLDQVLYADLQAPCAHGLLARQVASSIAGVAPRWLETIQGAAGDNAFGNYAAAVALGEHIPRRFLDTLKEPLRLTFTTPER